LAMRRVRKVTTEQTEVVARTRRSCRLPLEPLGLCREDAADFVGLSATKFEQLVADGRMPLPRQADGRVIWSRFELIEAFEALPRRAANSDTEDPWASQCA
jgi:hypothetical protein